MAVHRNDTLRKMGESGDPAQGPPRRHGTSAQPSRVSEVLRNAAASPKPKPQDPPVAPVEPEWTAAPSSANPTLTPEPPTISLHLNVHLRSTPDRILNLLREIHDMNTNANNEVKMDATNTADAADTTQTASGADQAKADTTQESTVDESLRKARRKSVLKSTGKMVGRVTLGLAAVAGTVFAGRYLYNRYGVTVPVVEG